MCFCFGNRRCLGVSLIVSAIVGVIVGFLRVMGVITVTPVILSVAFAIAILFLAVLLRGRDGCCELVDAMLIGIVGTIAVSVLLLVIPFAATSILGAVITGVLAAFFTLIIAAATCAIRCQQGCNS